MAVFDWSNSQNGKLLALIGVLAATIQGGYTRRFTAKLGEGIMARRGIISCAVGFGVLASLPLLVITGGADRTGKGAQSAIYIGAAFLAFTSATVVSSLTALASLQCDEEPLSQAAGNELKVTGELAKGRALGSFRSAGQLGRAIGPLLGTCDAH